MTDTQKNQVFSYLQNGDKLMKESEGMKSESYIQNTIILVDSIFQYAFMTESGQKSSLNSSSLTSSLISSTLKSTSSIFTSLGKSILSSSSSSKENSKDSSSASTLTNSVHYWDSIRTHFAHHDTVKYINFHYEDAASSKEKGIGWVLLLLIEKEFLGIITELFQNTTLLNMYNKQRSYFWKNQS